MQHKLCRKYATHKTSQLHSSVDPCCAPICSAIHLRILGVRSICILISWCAPHAASSITVDNQPFITQLHVNSYNFPALFQLNFSNKGPTGLNSQLRLYTEFLSEGLIFAYQQPHHRINKIQQWQR